MFVGLEGCGFAACASNAASCALGVAEMAKDVIIGTAELAAFVVSAGSSSGS